MIDAVGWALSAVAAGYGLMLALWIRGGSVQANDSELAGGVGCGLILGVLFLGLLLAIQGHLGRLG